MLKHRQRANDFINSTGNNWLRGDMREAKSYGWYTYLKEINGKLVLNRTHYSPTTDRHIMETYRALNYNVDIVLRNTRHSLDNLPLVVSGLGERITELQQLIDKPRSHKDKNDERRAEIALINNQIRELTRSA